MTNDEWQDCLDAAFMLAQERERICKLAPSCTKCGTNQVQLLDTESQKWKCRHCKTIIFTEV